MEKQPQDSPERQIKEEQRVQEIREKVLQPPPPVGPPPVAKQSASSGHATQQGIDGQHASPNKASDARSPIEADDEQQQPVPRTITPSNAVETLDSKSTSFRTADDEFDPLNQTLGSEKRPVVNVAANSEAEAPKKSYAVNEEFEISLDDLKFLERIGEGGFSVVHKAKSKTNQSTVAVKILKQQSPSEKTLESFAKEIWMHSQIRHPHVLQFFGGCTVVPKLCLVSEYMFCSLQHALDHDPGAFHPQSEVEIATSIALGLNHLHILNIMHRDLKASNVLLDKNYCNPKIADFGLARIRQEAESGSLTRGVGSPFAMAPEVFTSSDYAKPVDWYAFGVLIWQLMTKEHPYKGMKYVEIVNHVVKENKRLPIPGDCHELVSSLMKQCWDRDPGKRPLFPQVIEILEELAETLEGSMLTAMTEETVREEFPSGVNGMEGGAVGSGDDALEFVESDFLSQTLSWEDVLNLEAKINLKDMELEVVTLRRELEQAKRAASQDMAVQHYRSMQSKEQIMEEHEEELRHLETSILQERMRQKIKLRKRLRKQKNKQTRPDISYALSLLNNPPKTLAGGASSARDEVGDSRKEILVPKGEEGQQDLGESSEMI